MLKLNDTAVYVGQIKQILHTFNLPLCQIGRNYPRANTHFLVQDNIKRWDENQNEVFCETYIFGKAYPNITANFQIRNTLYDRETHRYLGKYLRFIRDYCGVNLMSMYNCFDGEINTAEIKFTLNASTDQAKEVSFKNGVGNSTVYKVPVSPSELTISTHSGNLVEICLYVDNSSSQYKDIINSIAKATYIKRKINGVLYYNPFTYIKDADLRAFVIKHIHELKLLIRVPEILKTSIVVLEGKYVAQNYPNMKYFSHRPCGYVEDTANTLLTAVNNWLIPPLPAILADKGELLFLVQSTPDVYADNSVDSGYKIASQLLSHENTSKNYLIGDRLIEYLTDNAITNLNQPYEIKRAQKTIDRFRYTDFGESYKRLKKIAQKSLDAALKIVEDPNSTDTEKAAAKALMVEIGQKFDQDLRALEDAYKVDVSTLPCMREDIPKDRYYGIWHYTDLQDIRALIYKNNLQLGYDALGYVDKDFEAIMRGDLDNVEL